MYVFGDAQQLELGAVSESDIALTALATVVSARDEVVVLDAGSKVLGADRAAWATGYGRILGEPDARTTHCRSTTRRFSGRRRRPAHDSATGSG